KNNIIAIKKLKIENENINNENNTNSNNNSISEESIREFLLEIKLLSYINHPNLLNFIGIVLSSPSIILPFANYGSLYNFIHNNNNNSENENTNNNNNFEEIYSFELILRIGLDIILGLNYLHSLNPSIIHCDLKSDNILIMNIDYKDINCVCKISDFGLSQFSVGRFLVNKNINPRWSAPEVIERKDQSIYSDIYSFGIILYELLTKQIPYSIQENPEWNFMINVGKSIIEGIKPNYSKQNIKNQFNQNN